MPNFESLVKDSQAIIRAEPDMRPDQFPAYVGRWDAWYEALWRDGHIRKIARYNHKHAEGGLRVIGYDGPADGGAIGQASAETVAQPEA